MLGLDDAGVVVDGVDLAPDALDPVGAGRAVVLLDLNQLPGVSIRDGKSSSKIAESFTVGVAVGQHRAAALAGARPVRVPPRLGAVLRVAESAGAPRGRALPPGPRADPLERRVDAERGDDETGWLACEAGSIAW